MSIPTVSENRSKFGDDYPVAHQNLQFILSYEHLSNVLDWIDDEHRDDDGRFFESDIIRWDDLNDALRGVETRINSPVLNTLPHGTNSELSVSILPNLSPEQIEALDLLFSNVPGIPRGLLVEASMKITRIILAIMEFSDSSSITSDDDLFDSENDLAFYLAMSMSFGKGTATNRQVVALYKALIIATLVQNGFYSEKDFEDINLLLEVAK